MSIENTPNFLWLLTKEARISENELLKMLNPLDFEEGDILFQQREEGEPRTAFALERQLYSFVSRGATDEMVEFYSALMAAQPDFRVAVGRLSRDALRQTKYAAVSLVAVVCRVAILSGVTEAVAYSKSDDVILRIDQLTDMGKIVELELASIYDYACLVAESKANRGYSKPVRAAIEFIVVNLHGDISLERLSESVGCGREHLARRFKKEVGQSVGGYILSLRIEEAKRLLLTGKTSREVSYLLNFCSQSYFIRQFKKVTGITPKQFCSGEMPVV